MATEEQTISTKKDNMQAGLMEYDGTYHLEGTDFVKVKNLKCRDTDIWVCSFPRSGTTLTQQTTYLIKTLDFVKGTTVPLDYRFPHLEYEAKDTDIFKGPDYVDQLTEGEPRFIKSHLHYRHLPIELLRGKGKKIYITRNPKAAVPSLYRFLKYLKLEPATSMREYLERFLTNKDVYACPWGPHVKEYWEHRNDPNVLFLQFEQTIRDRTETVRKIAEFLEVSLTDEEVDKVDQHTTIKSMKSNKSVNFANYEEEFNTDRTFGGLINKGEVSSWKQDIPVDLVLKFDEMIERELGNTDIIYN